MSDLTPGEHLYDNVDFCDELVPGVDYDESVCPNCGKNEHSPAELKTCLASMIGPGRCSECGNVNDDNPGDSMCRTCRDWVVTDENEPEMRADGTCRGCGADTGGKMPCAPECPIDGEVAGESARTTVTFEASPRPDFPEAVRVQVRGVMVPTPGWKSETTYTDYFLRGIESARVWAGDILVAYFGHSTTAARIIVRAAVAEYRATGSPSPEPGAGRARAGQPHREPEQDSPTGSPYGAPTGLSWEPEQVEPGARAGQPGQPHREPRAPEQDSPSPEPEQDSPTGSPYSLADIFIGILVVAGFTYLLIHVLVAGAFWR